MLFAVTQFDLCGWVTTYRRAVMKCSPPAPHPDAGAASTARPQCLGSAGGHGNLCLRGRSRQQKAESSQHVVMPSRAALVAPGGSLPGDVVASACDAGEQLRHDGGLQPASRCRHSRKAPARGMGTLLNADAAEDILHWKKNERMPLWGEQANPPMCHCQENIRL